MDLKPTDPREILRGFFRQAQTALKERGLWPQGLGTTSPVKDPESVEEMVGMVKEGAARASAKSGGLGYDRMGTPSSQTYAKRRFEFLSAEEGIREAAYDDSTGKPVAGSTTIKGNVTVGIGFNMERPDAREVFQSVLGMNSSDFDSVKAGRRNLTREQVRKLFDHTIQEAEQVVNRRLAGVPLTEDQRIALVSMAFNSPSLIGPKITEAIKTGNLEAVRDEILFNSGTKKLPFLAPRRYKEASMFLGMNREQFLPEAKEYLSQAYPQKYAVS